MALRKRIDLGVISTNSSPAMLRDQHWTNYLLPLCQRIAGAISNWALPRGTRFEFNPDRYLQQPFAERAAAWSILHVIVDEKGRRAATVPEIRVAERFAPWDVARLDPAGADSVVGSARG